MATPSGNIVKKLRITGLLLAGGILLGGTASANNLVPLADGSGWIDPTTGAFYPSVGDNTAVDQRSGRTLVVPSTGQRNQTRQANPASLDCQWVKHPDGQRSVLQCRQ